MSAAAPERCWRRCCAPTRPRDEGRRLYLVARPVGSDSPLVYRLSRITTASVLPESSDAPEAFDLAAFWESQARACEKTFESVHVTVRLPRALHGRVRAQQVGTERPESAHTLVVDLNLEGIDDAVSHLLVLGADLEVLGPPSMRDAEPVRCTASLVCMEGPRQGRRLPTTFRSHSSRPSVRFENRMEWRRPRHRPSTTHGGHSRLPAPPAER